MKYCGKNLKGIERLSQLRIMPQRIFLYPGICRK